MVLLGLGPSGLSFAASFGSWFPLRWGRPLGRVSCFGWALRLLLRIVGRPLCAADWIRCRSLPLFSSSFFLGFCAVFAGVASLGCVCHRSLASCLGSILCVCLSCFCPLCVLYSLFRQNTYLWNKKHMLTCQGGNWLFIKLLTTGPVVSWRGWETPPPPPQDTSSNCHSLLNHGWVNNLSLCVDCLR